MVMRELSSEEVAKRQTAAWKLTHTNWRFSVPMYQFKTQEYFDSVGVGVSGDKAIDKEALKQRVETSETLLEIARRHEQDHDIRLANPKDSVGMYEILREHLDNWAKGLRDDRNLDVDEQTLDELEMLDQLAADVYQIARRYKPNIQERKSIVNRLKNLGGGITRKSTFLDRAAEKPKEDTRPKEHTRMYDFMVEELERRRGGRR